MPGVYIAGRVRDSCDNYRLLQFVNNTTLTLIIRASGLPQGASSELAKALKSPDEIFYEYYSNLSILAYAKLYPYLYSLYIIANIPYLYRALLPAPLLPILCLITL